VKYKHGVGREIHAEQISLLYSALPISVLSSLLISAVLVFVEWSVLEQSHLVAWFSAMVCVQLLRAVLFLAYRKKFNSMAIHTWGNLFLLGSITGALVWAANILFLFPAVIEYQVFLAFVVAGMSAGAVTTLSSLRSPVMSFLSILLIPLIIKLFMQGGEISTAMAVMVSIFLILTLSTANRMFRNTSQNILMKYEVSDINSALAESESKYHHIFESVPLGIAHYNHGGTILDCNSKYRKLAGMKDDKSINWNLLKSGDSTDFQQQVQASLDKQFVQYEGQAGVIGGNDEVSIRAYLTAIESETKGPCEGVAIIQDITEDKQAEKAKQEFISTISHELRTPLTSIQAVLGLIEGGKVGEISEPVKPLIDIASRNSKRLASLINDILDLSKMTSSDVELDLVITEVKPLLEEILNMMKPYADQYNVKLIFNCHIDDVLVSVDKKRFTQIICNLLSNAAKFSPSGKAVTVGVSEADHKLRIEVTDHGPGIPDEFHDQVFERFTQHDASNTRAVGGTGLGLNISRLLVEQMNGVIGFTTEIDRGTTFFVEFTTVAEE